MDKRLVRTSIFVIFWVCVIFAVCFGVDAPEFSPDGKYIILGIGGIYRIKLDDMSFHRLTAPPAEGRDCEPSYSSDGTKIVFRRAYPPKPAFFIMNSDGSNLVEVAKIRDLDYAPRFSAHGHKIYFLHLGQEGSGRSAIYSMMLDGSGTQRLTNPEYWAVGESISLSPDGKHLLVSANRNGEGLDYGMALRIVDLNGAETIFKPNIAQYRPAQTSAYYSSVEDATFLPDGRTIVFMGHLKLKNLKGTPINDNPRTIYKYDLGTRETKKILNTSAYWAEGPNVSPDGTKMAFCTGTPYGCDKIWIANIDGSDLKNIAIKLK